VQISLDRARVMAVLPKVETGLGKYMWLQHYLHEVDVSSDAEFQRRFAGFYRVRRNATWRRAFFDLLEDVKRSRPAFGDVLHHLQETTGRVEASFASKLVATVDPDQPVIDSVVLRNLGLRLPYHSSAERITGVLRIHAELSARFARLLGTADGRALVQAFQSAYPDTNLSETKMLDLVLWQMRDSA